MFHCLQRSRIATFSESKTRKRFGTVKRHYIDVAASGQDLCLLLGEEFGFTVIDPTSDGV
jgi:hypothetical protein